MGTSAQGSHSVRAEAFGWAGFDGCVWAVIARRAAAAAVTNTVLLLLAGEWTKAEEDRVLALNKETPGRWAEIARQLGGGSLQQHCARSLRGANFPR